MGNSAGVSISIQVNDGRLLIPAGSTVEGRVTMDLSTSVSVRSIRYYDLYLVLSGKEKSYVFDVSSVSRAERRILYTNSLLHSFSDNTDDLNPGYHDFPFSFDVPASMPSSIRCESGKSWCEIKYKLKALLKKKNKSLESELEVYVLADPQPPALVPWIMEPILAEVKTFGVVKKGAVGIGVRLVDTHVSKGDYLEVYVACSNHTVVDVEHVQLTLWETMEWKTDAKRQRRARRILTHKTIHDLPDAMKRADDNDNVLGYHHERNRQDMFIELQRETNRVTIQVPMDTSDTYSGRLIQCRHHLEVKVKTSAMVDDPRVNVPLRLLDYTEKTQQEMLSTSLNTPVHRVSRITSTKNFVFGSLTYVPEHSHLLASTLQEEENDNSEEEEEEAGEEEEEEAGEEEEEAKEEAGEEEEEAEEEEREEAKEEAEGGEAQEEDQETEEAEQPEEVGEEGEAAEPSEEDNDNQQEGAASEDDNDDDNDDDQEDDRHAFAIRSVRAIQRDDEVYLRRENSLMLTDVFHQPRSRTSIVAPIVHVEPVAGGTHIVRQENRLSSFGSSQSFDSSSFQTSYGNDEDDNDDDDEEELSLPSVKTLLREMVASMDDYDIIHNKMENPEWRVIFSSLTPEEFGSIIAHVNLDFDQPKVAALLAMHLVVEAEFTCEYCKEGIVNTAQWNKPAMVHRLLPFCSDLEEQQDTITEQLSPWELTVTADDFVQALNDHSLSSSSLLNQSSSSSSQQQ